MKTFVTFDPAAVFFGGFELEERIAEDLRRFSAGDLQPPGGSMPSGRVIGFDTEYDPEGKLLTVAVADRHNSLAFETADGKWKKQITPLVKKAEALVGHSIGGDLDYLVAEGLAKERWVAGKDILDSLLICRMVDENRGKGGYSLEPLLLSDFNFDPWKAETEALLKKTGNAADWTVDQRTTRCRIDAWATVTLAAKHYKSLPEELSNVTHRIAMSLHRCGLAGAATDIKRFHERGKEWKAEAGILKQKVVRFALRQGMTAFSPTNDDHIRELVYDKLKLPVLESSEKTHSAKVDKGNLLKLIQEHKGHAILQTLLDFNSLDKLASTWYGSENAKSKKKSVADLIVPIPKRSDVGLLHFWIFPLRARTGRRSSGGSEEGSPESRNSQNWPPKARTVIRSRWKGGKIAVADYSKLEVVIIGWRSKDAKLLDYFTNKNGYITVAKEFWGQDVEDGTKLYKATKCLVLGLNYNMGWYKLAMDLWNKAGFHFSEDWKSHMLQTKEARIRYLNMFPGLKAYIRDQIGEMTETQQVVSPTGRVRHLPHHGPDSEGFWHLRNAAVNFPIQSMASDVTGTAIVDYEDELLKEHKLSFVEWHSALLQHPWDLPASPVFNEVHDELDLDLHPKSGKRDLEILVDCMRNVRTLKKLVPGFDLTLKVDVQVVNDWGAAK